MATELISFIIDCIKLSGSEEFINSVCLVPFVFFLIRQVFVLFNMMLRGVYKKW